MNYLCCQDGEGFILVMAKLTGRRSVPISHRFDLSHSRSKKTVPNETSYVTSYMSIMVTDPPTRDMSVIMGVKKLGHIIISITMYTVSLYYH